MKLPSVAQLQKKNLEFTAQSQPQTPASCPNRSPLSCFNTSVNGPTSAVETNKILTFREVDHPTNVITSRKISQNIQSSSAAASSLTSLTNTNRPPLSLLGILAAKRITRKFLSTLADEKHQRRLSTFSRLFSIHYTITVYGQCRIHFPKRIWMSVFLPFTQAIRSV
ncbi:unnamed protein product [Schistosoma bovis]|nr:unnamed protein product [Schistosoma bovis]